MVTNDDSNLVIKAQSGDDEAFAALLRRYSSAVYGYCYYRVSTFEDARDLCQDTFIRAYTHLHQLEDPCKFGAWLRRIAGNLCTQWFQRRRELSLDDMDPEQQQSASSPSVEFIQEALANLPDKERLTVVMHYVDGFSYNEIAQFLEISNGAVRGRLQRGRDMLKKEVLKLTKEMFDEHRPDAECILIAVKAAVSESYRAINDQRDVELAKTKVDEALDLVSGLEGNDQNTLRARHEALRGNYYLTIRLKGRGSEEHRENMRLLIKAAEALNDLKELAGWLYLAGEMNLDGCGDELLARAQSIYEELDDSAGLAILYRYHAWRELEAGNLAAARGLYARAVDRMRSGIQPLTGINLIIAACTEAHIAAIEPVESRDVCYMAAGDGFFAVCDGYIESRAGLDWPMVHSDPVIGNSLMSKSVPLHKAAHPSRLIPLDPALGMEWSQHVAAPGAKFYEETTVIESVTDQVDVPAGRFEDCIRTVSRTTGPDPDDDYSPRLMLGTRTQWFAPGVGIVRSIYELLNGQTRTFELLSFHLEGQEASYLPTVVGNWWKYRWVEVEDEYGWKTEYSVNIKYDEQEHEKALLALEYLNCVRS